MSIFFYLRHHYVVYNNTYYIRVRYEIERYFDKVSFYFNSSSKHSLFIFIFHNIIDFDRMYSQAAKKINDDDRKRKASEISSDEDSTNTPDPIKVETPSTSPQALKGFPFSPGKFVEAGCHSAVFTHYDKKEEASYRSDEWNKTMFTGQCKEDDIPAVGSVIALYGHHIDPDRFKDNKKRMDFYGVVVEWDKERFPEKEDKWVQVQVVGNGEYVTNEL